MDEQNRSNESLHSTESSQSKLDSDGALRTYIIQSLLDWQALTREQKEKACLEMVKIAQAELQNEVDD